MTTHILRCALFVATALLIGCGSEDPPHQPVTDGLPPWPDGNPWIDWGHIPQYDTGPLPDTGKPKDGAPTGDSSTSCPGPTGATCATSCQSTEICTAASGGKCAKLFTLSGSASSKAVLVQVATAYVECWNKAPSVDTLCSAFDTCALTGTLDEKTVRDWVCKTAQVSDFSTAATYNTAKTVCGCGTTQVDRPDWKISSIPTGKKGEVCLTYDVVSWWYDWITVDLCKNFPPK